MRHKKSTTRLYQTQNLQYGYYRKGHEKEKKTIDIRRHFELQYGDLPLEKWLETNGAWEFLDQTRQSDDENRCLTLF